MFKQQKVYRISYSKVYIRTSCRQWQCYISQSYPTLTFVSYTIFLGNVLSAMVETRVNLTILESRFGSKTNASETLITPKAIDEKWLTPNILELTGNSGISTVISCSYLNLCHEKWLICLVEKFEPSFGMVLKRANMEFLELDWSRP